jgi:hypothetical protein
MPDTARRPLPAGFLIVEVLFASDSRWFYGRHNMVCVK